MGIRVSCPRGHKLHVKNFLAGKRGVCPECGAKVDIPGNSPGSSEPKSVPAAAEKSSPPTHSTIHVEDTAPWHVQLPSGEQFGPALDPVFREWVQQGRVSKDCLVWREGWPDWRKAADVLPSISESSPVPPIPPPTPPDVGQPSAEVPSSEDSTTGTIQIHTHFPDSKKNSKQKSRRLVYFLVAACLLLSLTMVYVFSRN